MGGRGGRGALDPTGHRFVHVSNVLIMIDLYIVFKRTEIVYRITVFNFSTLGFFGLLTSFAQ